MAPLAGWGRDDDSSVRIARTLTEQSLLPKPNGKPSDILDPLWRTRAPARTKTAAPHFFLAPEQVNLRSVLDKGVRQIDTVQLRSRFHGWSVHVQDHTWF